MSSVLLMCFVQLSIKSYSDKNSTIHIDISSNASGLSTTQENRELDWKDRPHKDKIFGSVVGRSRLISSSSTFEPCESYSEADKQFLQGQHLKDGKTSSRFKDEESVQSYVKNQDSGHGWTAEQVWNFEEIQGKRYYTRRVVVRSKDGSKTEIVRLVYSYQGPLDAAKGEDDDDGLAYGDE